MDSREVVRPIAPFGRDSLDLSLSLDPPIPKKDRRFSRAGGGVWAGLDARGGPLDEVREKPDGPSEVCDD